MRIFLNRLDIRGCNLHSATKRGQGSQCTLTQIHFILYREYGNYMLKAYLSDCCMQPALIMLFIIAHRAICKSERVKVKFQHVYYFLLFIFNTASFSFYGANNTTKHPFPQNIRSCKDYFDGFDIR